MKGRSVSVPLALFAAQLWPIASIDLTRDHHSRSLTTLAGSLARGNSAAQV